MPSGKCNEQSRSKGYLCRMEGSYLEGVIKEGSPEKVTFELKYELSGEKKFPGGGNSRCDNPKEGMLSVNV